MTYSTREQTVDLDLYMQYAEGGPFSYGRFEYKDITDKDGLNPTLSEDGYTLTLTAHEKEPYIMPLALTSFDTVEVKLTVNIIIEKATPLITDKPVEGKYTVELSNSNYFIEEGAGDLIIDPIPMVLRWEGQLAFAHDGDEHTVEATVSNALKGEQVKPLKYENNTVSDINVYTAKVTELDNGNYTLEGGQNIEQLGASMRRTKILH